MSAPTVVATSPSADVASVAVLIDGSPIASEFHILSATVSHELDRIPSATLQLLDGEAAAQTFAASDTEHFVPGREIEIRLGYRGTTRGVFKGIVVANRIRVRKDGAHLSIECRDRAVRMTDGRRSRHVRDTTDGELLEDLIAAHGLEHDVTPTKPTLGEVVQYDATDWDFLVCRAEANGLHVMARDGRIKVQAPDLDAEPSLKIAYGSSVIELDAEIDARCQPQGIQAVTWSGNDHEVASTDGAEPTTTDSGNLAVDTLASVLGDDAHVLRHGGALADPELQAWADATLARGRLAKVRGRARVQGTDEVVVGDVVEVRGIGDRFSGGHLVSGIQHTFARGNWETDIAFGVRPEIHASTYPVTAPPAGGLVPGVHGIQLGIVTALEGDPEEADRIEVRLPMVGADGEGAWARLATLDAGSDRGTFFRPEIDDEVVVGFIDGDPRCAVVLGQCHSSNKRAPEAPDDDNHRKGYCSRSQLRLTFDDDKKEVVIETPGGNRATLSDDAGRVSLEDQHGNTLTMDDAGITITSAKDLTLKASGKVQISGSDVELTARSSFKASGQSGADLTSGGTLTVSGSLVRIN